MSHKRNFWSRMMWGDNSPLKRSRRLRWVLLVFLALFVGMIVAIVSSESGIIGLKRSLGVGQNVPIGGGLIGFITAGWLGGWGSPFRYRLKLFWQKNIKTKLVPTLPDEFEAAIYARANVLASRIITSAILGACMLLGIGLQIGGLVPTDAESWFVIGFSSVGICMLLPTLIAEFRTPFPNTSELVEDDQ